MKKRDKKDRPDLVPEIFAQQPSFTDPQGSWTGLPMNEHEIPVQLPCGSVKLGCWAKISGTSSGRSFLSRFFMLHLLSFSFRMCGFFRFYP